MDFIHYQVTAGPDECIRVKTTGPANVRVLDELDFEKYRRGVSGLGSGGPVANGTFEYRPRKRGLWHVVIDLDGFGGTIRAVVDVLRI